MVRSIFRLRYKFFAWWVVPTIARKSRKRSKQREDLHKSEATQTNLRAPNGHDEEATRYEHGQDILQREQGPPSKQPLARREEQEQLKGQGEDQGRDGTQEIALKAVT